MGSDWLTQGPPIEEFEEAVCERVGAEYAVAYSSATAGLHGAGAAAGLTPDSHLVTSSLSFIASANVGGYMGSRVSFADLDLDTMNLDLDLVARDADVVVPVHYAGLPVDLSGIERSACVVIEDAAHAIGALTPHGPVGNCANSDMTVFSFHPVKTVTSGEGGVVTTNNADLAEFLRRFRHHGIERVDGAPAWHYTIPELAFNYRMTGLQAALGQNQLRHLDSFLERRIAIADVYDAAFADSVVVTPPRPLAGFTHGLHLYVIRVPHRRFVFDFLRSQNIGVQVHYVPIHHHGPYLSDDAGLPNTMATYESIISLPLFPTLTGQEQDRVVATVLTALRMAES